MNLEYDAKCRQVYNVVRTLDFEIAVAVLESTKMGIFLHQWESIKE